jgi:hypothetical protein
MIANSLIGGFVVSFSIGFIYLSNLSLHD